MHVIPALRRSIILAVVLFGATGQALAQGDNGPNQGPWQEINFNLTDGIVNRTLPFDVPFVLTGQVPSAVTQVRAYLVKAADVQSTGGAFATLTCGAMEWWNDKNLVDTWTVPPSGLTVPPPSNSTRSFKLLFPAIDVNTEYCTHFDVQRELSDAEGIQFRQQASRAIDLELQRLGLENRNLNAGELEALRQRLIAAVRSTNTRIVAPNGSMFDPRPASQMNDADRNRALNELLDKVVGPLEAQFQRNGRIQAYDRMTKIAQTALTRLRDSELLEKRAAGLSAELGDDRTRLDQFFAASDDVIRALAQGLRTVDGDTRLAPVTDVWEVDRTGDCAVPAIASAIANLVTTRDFFIRVRQILENDPELKKDAAGREALLALFTQDNNGLQPALGAVRTTLQPIRDQLCQRADSIQKVADEIHAVAVDEVTLIVTTTGNFATRHAWYFSVDVGMAVAPVIGEIFPYVGVNIYFRPVNKETRLSSLRNTFARRFAVVLGYTWTDNLLETNQRFGLFTKDKPVGLTVENKPSDMMLVFGAGFRFTDALRVVGGALLFKSADPNPLITKTGLDATPFISMSFDWDAVGNVKGLGGLMGFGSTPVPVPISPPNPPTPAPDAPSNNVSETPPTK